MMFWYRIRLISFFSLFLLLTGCLSYSEDRNGPSFLEQGKSYYFNQKYELAQKALIPLAKEDDEEAQYYLALALKARNHFHEAAEWFIKSGDNGYVPAYFQIGLMHDNGEGFSPDPLNAMDWYRKSKLAESTASPTIQFYKNNKAFDNQKIKASALFEEQNELAENGDAEAQFQVAQRLDYGGLIPENFSKALYWYRRAADNGHEQAQFMMGYFYCRGIGTERDVSVANKWLLKSGRSSFCQ